MRWIDPDYLPEAHGNVERFVVNTHGEIDGIILSGATEATLVHVPPHLSIEMEAAIQIGDAVCVRGVRPRGTRMIAAVALIAADGRVIIDRGPKDKQDEEVRRTHSQRPSRPEDVKVAGKVRLLLHAPKGELRGAILDDGSIVRIASNEARRFIEFLRPGVSVAVRGEGIETPYGRVVECREIGSGLDSLMPMKGQKSKRRDRIDCGRDISPTGDNLPPQWE
jgi:hypothetical protein